jgi:SAM-dependent methyltransferase
MDVLAEFKQTQKQSWANFSVLETLTTPPAAQLVNRARVRPGQAVLDVACGTGVVAITAAGRGARVTALDLTPELLARARENAALAQADVEWHEGDVEQLPFADATFDVVLSQFGHMFAPRPEVATAEMLRVLKPGGTIAFSTWPPELLVGRLFALTGRYLPPPPAGVAPPPLWGEPAVIRERLGSAVKDLSFDRGQMTVPALSAQHLRALTESGGGPMRRVVGMLSTTDPDRLAAFRAEYDAIVADYLDDNLVRQSFLMTRATKI